MTDEKARVAETPADDPRGRTDTDDPDDYEAEFEDLDLKVVVVQCLAELQQIRMLLDDADDAVSDPDTDTAERFRCTRCVDTVVNADERQRHAREQHKAPPDMVESLFERVE